VVRDLPGMAPYTSQTELVSGEVGDDLAAYFTLSDQVPTSVGVGVLVAPDAHVLQAGGFIVQLMPDHEYFLIDELERNLRDVTSVTSLLERGMGPSDVLRLVLAGLDYEELEVSPVEFHCGCNKERATRATLALGRAELEDMVAKGEAAEVHCHFCGTTHYLSPDELRALLEDSPVV
jgi:molecular chaperone Hsp33